LLIKSFETVTASGVGPGGGLPGFGFGVGYQIKIKQLFNSKITSMILTLLN